MAVEPKIQIDTKDFRLAVVRARLLFKKDLAEEINISARYITARVYRGTKQSKGKVIRAELNGPTPLNPKYPWSETIMANRNRKTGNWPKGRYAVRRQGRRMTAARASSAGYLKAGWIPAMRTFNLRAAARLANFQNQRGDAGAANRRQLRPLAFIEHELGTLFQDVNPGLIQRSVDLQTAFLHRSIAKRLRRLQNEAARR